MVKADFSVISAPGRSGVTDSLVSQSIRTEIALLHAVPAPRIVPASPRHADARQFALRNRVAERRVNAEIALRRSLIVARKHGVDRAKDQGL